MNSSHNLMLLTRDDMGKIICPDCGTSDTEELEFGLVFCCNCNNYISDEVTECNDDTYVRMYVCT